jgi:hypothetical protein
VRRLQFALAVACRQLLVAPSSVIDRELSVHQVFRSQQTRSTYYLMSQLRATYSPDNYPLKKTQRTETFALYAPSFTGHRNNQRDRKTRSTALAQGGYSWLHNDKRSRVKESTNNAPKHHVNRIK